MAVRYMNACKVYRRHRCSRSHRTYQALGECIWPRAAWVTGEGPYATVAYCRVTTVLLHRTFEAAAEAKRAIDYTACGGVCTRRHEIIKLERPRTEVGA